MNLKNWIKQNTYKINIFGIALFVFMLWLAFSPPNPARQSIGSWFGGIAPIFLFVALIGIIMLIFGQKFKASSLSGTGIALLVLGAILWYSIGWIQNLFATMNPIILILVVIAFVWWITTFRQQPGY